MVQVNWKENMVFEASTPTGNKLTMDGYPGEGEVSAGPTPLEALLASVAGCSAMDVISVLEKKRQVVTAYRVEIDGERAPEGTWPRPYLSLTIKHIVSGDGLDPVAVARAVELSDTKYCSVVSTLRVSPTVESIWEIE